MAVPKVEVDTMWNSDPIKQGADESAAAVDSFATEVDAASEKVQSALRSMDDTAGTAMAGLGQEVEQGESKLQSMGQTASEEIPGALTDLSDSAADAATGLSTAFATLGPGGIALGAALAGIGILMRKSEEAKERIKADAAEWRDAYVEGLGRINAAARRAAIEADQADPESALARIEEVRSRTRLDYPAVLGALYGTPAQRAESIKDLDKATAQAEAAFSQAVAEEGIRSELAAKARAEVEALGEIRDLLGEGNEARRQGKDQAQQTIEAYQRLGLLTKEEKDRLVEMDSYWESIEGHAREVEALSGRIGGNLGNAVRQAGLLDLAINGVTP